MFRDLEGTMQEESHAPELFRLMYGEEAERQHLLAGERLKGWA
jgi:hypothetical protein